MDATVARSGRRGQGMCRDWYRRDTSRHGRGTTGVSVPEGYLAHRHRRRYPVDDAGVPWTDAGSGGATPGPVDDAGSGGAMSGPAARRSDRLAEFVQL